MFGVSVVCGVMLLLFSFGFVFCSGFFFRTLFLVRNNPESVVWHGKYTLSKTFLLARCNIWAQQKASGKRLLQTQQTDTKPLQEIQSLPEHQISATSLKNKRAG